jgi:2-keto-4-pentenoate hydratase/2-oxohepta-3-ene-1,7-dioic acid hydratase in catechol pathway
MKDLTEYDDPLDYVLGYTVGNNLTSRYWQDPERSSSQAGYAKSFDGFGPIGPFIISTLFISDPGQLTLTVRVNGEQRQRANTNDLVFDVRSIIRVLARGRTIRAGTIIMTGTPSGVGALLTPPRFLKHGDVAEVEIEKIGLIKNRVVFQE